MTAPSKLLPLFQETGRALLDAGLIEANSGNLSVRSGDIITITRHDAELGHLEANDLIEVALDGPADPSASVEFPAHRFIYRLTSARAIVHAHPPATIAVSLASRRIELPPPTVSVVEAPSGSDALAEVVAKALRESPVVIARGHGTFAVGATPAEACERTLWLEEVCRRTKQEPES